MTYKDTVTLAEMVSDGYGDKRVSEVQDILGLFLHSTGNSHSNNVDIATSDAHVYLNHEDPLVLEKGYKLEGMYLRENTLNAPNDTWYKIERVQLGERKLLTNEVDNVHAFLQKVAEPDVIPSD